MLSSTADFEAASADFLYYTEAVKINSEVFDHTGTGTTHYSARLNGSQKERYGLAKSLKVMPGDKVNAKVFAKYLDPDTTWINGLPAFVASIGNGTAASGTFVDGGLAGSTGGVLVPFWALFTDNYDDDDDDLPKAYLNWLVFDEDYNLVPEKSHYQQISRLGREYGQNGSHDSLKATIDIDRAGFVYLFVSNDHYAIEGEMVEVYFDDFKVEHIKSPVIESSDYYPFGLTFNNYRRENSLANQFEFNGKELQDELNLGWLDFGARMYDAALGRWFVIDPLAEKSRRWSPYVFGFDNPLRFIDPDGMEAVDPQQKDPKEKTAKDLDKAQEGKTVQDRLTNVNNSLEKGDYVKGETVKELANIPSTKQKGERSDVDSQRKVIDQIDKIEKTENGYVIKLKNDQESISASIPIVGKDGEVKMNLDLKIENGATINISTDKKGNTNIDFSGIKAGKGFAKIGLPTVKVKGDEGSVFGISFPLAK